MALQIMTIVWDTNDEEPIIMSSGVPGCVMFHEADLRFLEKVTASVKKKYERLLKKSFGQDYNS